MMKLLSKDKFYFKIAFVLFAISYHGIACAQTITENIPLDFGRFVLVDNNAPRSIQLFPGGGFTADPQYYFISDPQLGNITVDGYPPGTPLFVTVSVTTLISGGFRTFDTVSTFTSPALITTDGAGEATFDVGATLVSDGSGLVHDDGGYNGTYTVTVTP